MNLVQVKKFITVIILSFSGNIITSNMSHSIMVASHFAYGIAEAQGLRPTMEDAHKIVITKDYEYYGLFDGHGGKQVADYVSEKLDDNIFNLIKACENISLGNKIINLFNSAFDKLDKDLEQKAYSKKQGCTALVAFIQKYNNSKQLFIANLGDSRAVISKHGKAEALSVDHKPNREDEKLRIEKSGGEVIFYGCWRVNGQLAVSRAFGDKLLHPYVTAEPEIRSVSLGKQDEFLILACDGVWDVLDNQQAVDCVRNELKKSGDSTKAANVLKDLALKNGSTDNITVIVVNFQKKLNSKN